MQLNNHPSNHESDLTLEKHKQTQSTAYETAKILASREHKEQKNQSIHNLLEALKADITKQPESIESNEAQIFTLEGHEIKDIREKKETYTSTEINARNEAIKVMNGEYIAAA